MDSAFQLLLSAKLDKAEIDKQLKEISSKKTVKVNLETNAEQFLSEVKKFKDLNGDIITQTDKLNKKTNEVERTYSRLHQEAKKVKKETDNVNTSTKNVEKSVKDVDTATKKVEKSVKNVDTASKTLNKTAEKTHQTFGDIVTKVGKFYLATVPIQAFTAGVREAKDAIFEFDDALTEFKKVSDLRGNDLDNYTDKLGELGSTVARTRKHFLREHIVICVKNRVNCWKILRAL